MKIKAHIHLVFEKSLSIVRTDLEDCAGNNILTFCPDVEHHSDESISAYFTYESIYAKSLHALLYSFVDFATSAAGVHMHKVWFDSIVEENND